jgi:hypothetical protein
VSSLASNLPSTGGAKKDDPLAFIVTSHAQGHCTTPFCDAIVQFPVPTPLTIVDKYPHNFNSDDSLSNDGVKDNTLLANIPPPSDGGGLLS